MEVEAGVGVGVEVSVGIVLEVEVEAEVDINVVDVKIDVVDAVVNEGCVKEEVGEMVDGVLLGVELD